MELSQEGLHRFFSTTSSHLNERQRRLCLGAMAVALGRGGQARVVSASGASTSTVARAVNEVRAGVEPSRRQRKPGGGRRPATDAQAGLLDALDALLKPSRSRGAWSPLRWTAESSDSLAGHLQAKGFVAGPDLVRELLRGMGFAMQPAGRNAALRETDRDRQFAYINQLAADRITAGEPVIVVRGERKERVDHEGDRLDGGFGEVSDMIRALDVDSADAAWASAGDSSTVAQFAVDSIRRWWLGHAEKLLPSARSLMIADCSRGSGHHWDRAWRRHLSRLAREADVQITVCHLPIAIAKWQQIRQRFVTLASVHRRGPVFTDLRCRIELVVAPIFTSAALVHASFDPNWEPTNAAATAAEAAVGRLKPHAWSGERNFTVTP